LPKIEKKNPAHASMLMHSPYMNAALNKMLKNKMERRRAISKKDMEVSRNLEDSYNVKSYEREEPKSRKLM
jgi:hypothetical protein